MDKDFLDKDFLKGIIKKYRGNPGEILEMLLDIQEKEKYLPRKALNYLSEKLDLPLTQIYRLAEFYESLSLKPMGRCQINVCTGTACHVRGASQILEEFEHRLGIKAGEVTPDLNFGLKKVNCVGTCALGPVVTVQDRYLGNMSPLKVKKVIQEHSDFRDREKKHA